MSLLEVASLGRQLQHNWIVQNINFNQLSLQNIAIAGETGSGKSTLLRMIAGLAQPHTGTVHFEGERVEGPAEKLIPGHPGIAYLSQVYELPKFLRVEQVLQYANKMSATEARQLFDICRITHLLKRRTDELSGGEQQRIALARLLVMQPRLLLLDEPFSNLDLIHKNLLKTVLAEAQQRLQLSLILTSHDPQDTLSWASKIGVMKAGAMLQWDTPEQIYRKPQDEYTAGLFGKYNLLSRDVAMALLPGYPYGEEGKILVRPEAFTEGHGGATALVKSVRFTGSFYETDMWIEDQLLTMYNCNGSLEKGSRIQVALQPQDAWRLES